MISESDKTRIEKEADYSTERTYIHKTSAQHAYRKGYIAGATAEHTRAWNAAIDQCIGEISDRVVRDKLESLKIKE